MSAHQPYPPARQAWAVVGVLMLALLVSFVDRQILSLMVGPIRIHLGLTDTEVSLLHGLAFAIFYTFMGVALGRLADHGHRQSMIIIGMVIWCLATAACGLANSFMALFLARIVVGIGEAALSPAAYSLISDYFPPHRRGRAMGVYTMGIFLGSGMALILGGLAVAATAKAGPITLPLLGTLHPWQAAFFIVGLPGLSVAALMLTVREPVRRERGQQESAEGTIAFLSARRTVFTLTLAGFAFSSVVTSCLAAWLPTTFIRIHGWTAPEIATAYGIIMLTAGCGGVLTGGGLGDRMTAAGRTDGTILAALAGTLLLLPFVPLVGLASSPWLALAGLAIVTFGQGMPAAVAPAALHGITPNEHRGQVTALYLFTANMIGLGGGPLFVALLTDRLFEDDQSVALSITIVTFIAAMCSLIALILARPAYRRAAMAARSHVQFRKDI